MVSMNSFYIVLLALFVTSSNTVPLNNSNSVNNFLTALCNGSYICLNPNTSFKCIHLNKLCNGQKDCPMGDDENNDLCGEINKLQQDKKNLEDSLQRQHSGSENDFSGTGFMFSVNNLIIDGGSNVKMFNQNSDNNVPDEQNLPALGFESNQKQ